MPFFFTAHILHIFTYLFVSLRRKSVFSLNELGQMNGTAGGGGPVGEDEEMPVPHELGEELAFTGRWVCEYTD